MGEPLLADIAPETLDRLPLDALVELRQQHRYRLADLEAAITRRLAAPPRAEQAAAKAGQKTDEYLTVAELAGRIGYETQTIRNLMAKGAAVDRLLGSS